MELTIFQKDLTGREEKLFTDYVQKKLPSIKNFLKNFPEDSQILRVSIIRFEKHTAYEVEFCLALPTKTLVAKETSHAITKAVDLSKDRLIAQIKKHMEALRGERKHKSLSKKEAMTEIVEKMSSEVY